MRQTLHDSASVPSIWRERDVWLVLPARTLVAAGNALAFVTLLLRVHDEIGAPWAITALLACFSVPTIATMGIAGRWADRYDSRMLLTVGLGLQVVAAAGLALAVGLPALLALVLAFEVGQALVAPVWAALLPRVVGEDRLGSAISWQQGLTAAAGPAGGALAGVVYQLAGGSIAFWWTSGACLLLLLTSWQLRTRRHLAAEAAAGGEADAVRGDPGGDQPEQTAVVRAIGNHNSAGGARSGWLAGVTVLRADRVVWPLFLGLLAMVVLVEGVNAGEIFLARDALGADPAQYGLGEVASLVGGVGGAALAGRLTGDRARVRGTVVGFAAACLAITLAGLAPSYRYYFGLIVVLAAGAGAGNACNATLVMTRTAERDRGKVQAALAGLARAAGLIALAAGGMAATLLGPRVLFVGAGIGGLVVLGFVTVRVLAALSRVGAADSPV